MAIFYRVNSLSRVLEDALMKQAIPYQIARGTEFYARKEIKDVLSYLRVISNPDDSVSLERIINVPTRGLGDTSVMKIQAYASQQRMGLLEACGAADRVPDLATRAVNSAKKVAAFFEGWRKLISGGGAEKQVPPDQERQEEVLVEDPLFDASLLAAAEEEQAEVINAATDAGTGKPSFLIPGGIRGLMERVVKESGMEDDLKKDDKGEDAGSDRLANVNELITVAAEFDAQNPEGTLDDYLQQVTLVSDVDKIKDSGGAVTLMTLHAAKGLEFPYVAMVGMEDGLIPHARAIGFSANPDEMEEERRLAFVGITRAMKQLSLSYARYRMIRGQTERTIASQFLKEMPEECFEEIDLTTDEEEAGSGSYRDEASYGRRAQQTRREHESVAQRREANEMAGKFRKGSLVRHPQFGLGRIEEISPAGAMTRAVVQFQGMGRKTLILQYARLEKVDA
jgi:DNA helicase-2/ATP-dependent DNA helicase PcrA